MHATVHHPFEACVWPAGRLHQPDESCLGVSHMRGSVAQYVHASYPCRSRKSHATLKRRMDFATGMWQQF